jgi:hemolysin III
MTLTEAQPVAVAIVEEVAGSRNSQRYGIMPQFFAVMTDLMDHCAHPQHHLPASRRSSRDELMNAATHGFGLLLAVVGALVMTVGMSAHGESRLVIGCGLYLASLVSVYAMSTLSHSSTSPRWKPLFRQLDQGFIYLLIAATYTPFSLAYLRGGLWWVLLGAMWVAALYGFAAKVFFAHRVEAVSIASYILLGWLPIISLPTLLRSAPIGTSVSILAGGLCYTVGTLFLVYDGRARHFHAVWHLCVIAGSACHFLGMLMFVVPGG